MVDFPPLFRALALVLGVTILSACASGGPVVTMKSGATSTLINWDQAAQQGDEECYNLFTKYNRWGVFIGCQAIDIFDVRTPDLNSYFVDNLSLQSCSTRLQSSGKRNYIRTGEHLLFIDKTGTNANAWFVPAGYYSDGVSTPDIIREILPGAILDTESPKTLSAALFHDRYFCLFEYSRFAWDQSRESFPDRLKSSAASLPIAYRRKGCSNTSFRNGLRAAGASSFISTVFRSMVGFVNPGKVGYCPRYVHADALARLDAQFEAMLEVGPIGSAGREELLPGCHRKEPLVMCLSRVEALWSLVTTRADDYDFSGSARRISDEWRQVFMRMMCYEIQAHSLRQENNDKYKWRWKGHFTQAQSEEACHFLDLNKLPAENEELRQRFQTEHEIYQNQDLPIESPFRIGDFIVESALMLMTEGEGPESFLRTVSGMKTIDYALLAVVQWNENYKDKHPEEFSIFAEGEEVEKSVQ